MGPFCYVYRLKVISMTDHANNGGGVHHVQVIYKSTKDLIPYVNNARLHSDSQVTQIAASIKEFGFNNPILLDGANGVIAGHGRLLAAQKLGLSDVPCIELSHMSETQKKAYILADNKLALNAQWDEELLKLELDALRAEDFDLDLTGFDLDAADGEEDDPWAPNPELRGGLARDFIYAPFSVLNTHEKVFFERTKQWEALGLNSLQGRDDGLIFDAKRINPNMKNIADTSVFNPTLCELMLTWFSKAGDTVLDPFAGGAVRGIVASKLGRCYHGVDLRSEQIEANQEHAKGMGLELAPNWIVGDSMHIDQLCPDLSADFVFSCPPYADLEQYSDLPNDLSNMDYSEFLAAYRTIIAKSCAMLKPDRFACFVVSEVRDKAGNYRNFVADTIKAFLDAGMNYYNELILINSPGTLPMRVRSHFVKSRKVGRRHQNVLVFVKGDGKAATDRLGPVEVCELAEEREK